MIAGLVHSRRSPSRVTLRVSLGWLECLSGVTGSGTSLGCLEGQIDCLPGALQALCLSRGPHSTDSQMYPDQDSESERTLAEYEIQKVTDNGCWAVIHTGREVCCSRRKYANSQTAYFQPRLDCPFFFKPSRILNLPS